MLVLVLLFSSILANATGIPSEVELAKMFKQKYQLEKLFVSIDKQENILVTGFFSDSVHIEDCTLQSEGKLDIFIAKYNRNLELEWLRHAGGADIDFSKFIKTDKYDNIYIQGLYKGVARFEGYVLDSRGTYDYFTAKYSYSGQLLWVKTRKENAIIQTPEKEDTI